MEQLLHTYEPIKDTFLIWIGLLIFVASGVGSWVLFRQKLNRTAYTGLSAMLLGFVAMIALCTTILGFWAFYKTSTVRLYADAIEVGRERISFAAIKNALLKKDDLPSLLDPTLVKKSSVLLLIERRDGKTYALSSHHYPVNEMLSDLKAAVNAQQEDQEKE